MPSGHQPQAGRRAGPQCLAAGRTRRSPRGVRV